jgi:hypothetical protein
MSEENLNATETVAETTTEETSTEEMVPKSEISGLYSALQKEREARKIIEKEIKEKDQKLERFKDVNPAEYQKLVEEASAAAAAQAAAQERTQLLEEKYGAQAAEATKKAEVANRELLEFRKRYALEKVFFAAGGRTDSADGVSFFDMLANQIGGQFRLNGDNTVSVVDSNGDKILDSETGKPIAPEDFLTGYKTHPIYGTFFKGSKGSGAGLGYSGTDANGIPVQDLDSMTVNDLFRQAWG